MRRVFQSLVFSALVFWAFNCTNAQSILSIALKLETGINTHAPQCVITNTRVSSKKKEQGGIMFDLSCEDQWVRLIVAEHESADQARNILQEGLAKVDSTLYRTIELPNLGDEGYTFAKWDGSKPDLGTLSFRIGRVSFGVTSGSDKMTLSVANSVSTFMQAT